MLAQAQRQSNEIDWAKHYPQLHMQSVRLVNQMKLPRWQGEEEDIAWDVVQESMRKIFEYTRRVERGEEKPVQEVAGLLHITARNSLLDRRRRERRLCAESAYAAPSFADTTVHLSEIATENVYRERLFRLVARKIARFPAKQRRALLIDLAGRMAFGERPTVLQAAFQAEGIQLADYRDLQPADEQERNRHAALLYQAYRRLKDLVDEDLREYLA